MCLGNLTDGVAQLLAGYEFAALAQILLQFLRSYNEDEPYYKIDNWPLARRR